MFNIVRDQVFCSFVVASLLLLGGHANSQTAPLSPCSNCSVGPASSGISSPVNSAAQSQAHDNVTQSAESAKQPHVKSKDDAGLTKTEDKDKDAAIGKSPEAKALPTSFQLKAAEVLHAIPPIFGSSFFQAPESFTPAQDIQVPADYVLAPGDEIILHIWGPVTIDSHLTVDRAGRIYIPQVGDVQVAGTAFSHLQDRIKAAVDRYFRNYSISVELGQLRSIQIFVTGEAMQPGSYTISSFSTLINALFASGGPSPQGSYRKIELHRGAQTITTIDLYQFLRYGDKSQDVRLLPGDVIFIPPVGQLVAVGGSVKVPAVYELADKESLEDLIVLAGGPSTTAALSNAISVERTLRNDKHIALNIPFADAAKMQAHNGDILSVPEIPPVYDKTVTLRGNILNPGRFTWRPGLKVSDILPEKAALLTQDYWKNRNKLLQQPQFEPLISGSRNAVATVSTGVVENAKPASTYNNGNQNAVQSEVTHAVTVKIPAPDIDWSYAVIERTDAATLKSILIPFNLGKIVLDHDPSADKLLQPGDIVTIFSQGDITVARSQQTKFVRIEGEVKMAGIYSAHEGETIQDLVQRAGGLTPDAYLFGAQFLRESARIAQQQRLDEYVERLTSELQHSMINLSLNGGSANDPAGVAAASNDLIQRIARQRATGRVVLTTIPASHSIADLPAITPEDGDVLIVPSRPATVGVIGAVNNQSSYLYIQGGKVKRYLALAGGATRSGDTKHIFVIRANGSVISKNEHGFSALRLAPGDTVVVPEKSFSISKLRMLLNSGISQMALLAGIITSTR